MTCIALCLTRIGRKICRPYVCVCVCALARARACVCVHACVRACVCVSWCVNVASAIALPVCLEDGCCKNFLYFHLDESRGQKFEDLWNEPLVGGGFLRWANLRSKRHDNITIKK